MLIMENQTEIKYDKYLHKEDIFEKHRQLSNSEKLQMKEWAQKQYKIGDPINPLWHPQLIYEIGLAINNRHIDKVLLA